jgi:hypothetical protein
LTENARAGGGEWMSKRDASAVWVHALAREASKSVLHAGFGAHEGRILERFDVAQHLRGKCFVNFP